MHNWDSSRENTTLLRFLDTFAFLLVSELGTGPSAVLFLNGKTSPLQSPATHVDPLGWLELRSAQCCPLHSNNWVN